MAKIYDVIMTITILFPHGQLYPPSGEESPFLLRFLNRVVGKVSEVAGNCLLLMTTIFP